MKKVSLAWGQVNNMILIGWAVITCATSLENLSTGFPTRSYINWAVQLQIIYKGLKIWIQEVGGLHCVAKTKALISCRVTTQLICTFVFVFA